MAMVMSEADVLWVLDVLEDAGITVYLDGGWAVDALLGRQTREHDDMDIAIPMRDGEKVKTALAAQGFELWRDDGPANWVVMDASGRKVDIHLVDFEGRSRGGEYYGSEGILYHVGSLEGTGRIAGREVRCPLPEFLVRWHTGYEHDEDDARDVFALCEHFGIDVPEQYGKSG
jgi:hypothetical protein